MSSERRPCQGICGRNVLYAQRTAFRFTVTRAHKFAELYCRRHVIAVCILERPERAAFLHYLIDLVHYLQANIVRQRNERQTTDNGAYPSKAGSFVNGGYFAGVSADEPHTVEIFLKRIYQFLIDLDTKI